MCRNGAKTGTVAMEAMHRLILKVLILGLAGLFVAVAGLATRGSAARLVVEATCRTLAMVTSAFASPSLSNNLFKMF